MVIKSWSKLSLLFVIFIIILLGCEKDPKQDDGQITDGISFTSFKLEKKHNPHLKEDITFVIGKESIETNGLSRYFPKVVPTYSANVDNIEINGKKQTSGLDTLDLRENLKYTLISSDGLKKTYEIGIRWSSEIAQLKIKILNQASITSKTTYVDASIAFEGKNFYKDLNGDGQIRGRGNSTWGMPKKPYKIKLKSDASLAGLKPEKDWVLLANFLDGTHLLNPVAFKIASQLEMPYTNNAIPVELSLNGAYAGLYLLTEQIEVKKNRVDIGKDGLLLQLDTYYDEEYKFRSTPYNLPVLIMNPELTSQSQVDPIKNDFNTLTNLISAPQFPNNNYSDFFDIDAFANFMIVSMLTDNGELNHPKSTFIHKTTTGKYSMGPVWDFDWAYGYEGTQIHFIKSNNPIFWNSNPLGKQFFSQLIKDPKSKALIKQKWANYKANHFNNLMTYIDEYAFLISDARQLDFEKWKRGNFNYKTDVENLKTWLQNRSEYLTTYINTL